MPTLYPLKKEFHHTETIWIHCSCLSQCLLIVFHAIDSTNLPNANQISLETGVVIKIFCYQVLPQF